MRWSLALIAGGGLAGAVHAATGAVRVGSTATTAGAANPFWALLELAGAAGLSVGAFALPVGAFGVVVALAVGAALWLRRRRRQVGLRVTLLSEAGSEALRR